MNFADALLLIFEGRTVTRESWPAGHRLVMVPPSGDARDPDYPYLLLFGAEGRTWAFWTPTNQEMMANDWKRLT